MKFVDSILLIGISASIILALISVFGSGIYWTTYGIRLSSQTLWRPATAAIALSVLWLRRSDLRQQHLANAWAQALRRSTAVAIVLAALAVVIGIRLTAFEVYGADTYGYVSEAQLWAGGNLIQHQPLSLDAPWPEPEWTFSPLGYRPGLQRGTIVPIYPTGLPLLMSGLLRLFGEDGPFFVVPILGGLAVFATFLLGRRVAGAACGLASAALLLTSPIFLYQLKEPMSDVPVTAWWLVAILLVSRATPTFFFAGGMATSAALLTRPNLVPLTAVLAIFVLTCSAQTPGRRLFNAFVYTLGVIPGFFGVAMSESAIESVRPDM
jgi:asparagine N-glycosylation enzyme membrane subunit Stt3